MTFEIKAVLLIAMLFMHILADFHLQGCLKEMKQRKWWEDLFLKEKDPYAEYYAYRNDYKMALVIHAFEWSVLVHMPVLLICIYKNHQMAIYSLIVYIIGNTFIHAYIDNKKCNTYDITLIKDQIAHIIQIVLTWILTICLYF